MTLRGKAGLGGTCPASGAQSHQKEASLSRPSPLAGECPYLPSLQSLGFPSKLGLFISLSALDAQFWEKMTQSAQLPSPLVRPDLTLVGHRG